MLNIDGKYLFRFETAKSTLALHFTSHCQSDENKVKVFIRSVIVVVVVAVDVFSFPFEKKNNEQEEFFNASLHMRHSMAENCRLMQSKLAM